MSRGVFLSGPNLPVAQTPDIPVLPARIPLFYDIAQTLTCYDGHVYDLTNPFGGVVLTAHESLAGFMPGPRTDYKVRTASRAGTRRRGDYYDERPVHWPLLVRSPSSQVASSAAFLDVDSDLFDRLDPAFTSTWSVTPPGRETRTLDVRFDKVEPDLDGDPVGRGWVLYGIDGIAEQPHWAGPPVTQTWRTEQPRNFYGGGDPAVDGLGPDLYVGSSFDASTASIENPGKVAVRPIWTLYGPMTSCTVGVEGKIITYAQPIPAGEQRIINTDAAVLTVVDQDGLSRLGDVTTFQPRSIPARGVVDLTVAISGTGVVGMYFVPLHHRPWG